MKFCTICCKKTLQQAFTGAFLPILPMESGLLEDVENCVVFFVFIKLRLFLIISNFAPDL